MMFLDIIFGIFDLIAMGWVYMILIILIECFIATKLLNKKEWYNTKVWLTITTSNIITGFIGIKTTLFFFNKGSFHKVWFPWISDCYMCWDNQRHIGEMIYYLFLAFILSLIIEFIINFIILSRFYNIKSIFRTTLIANIASYVFGAIIIYLYFFQFNK
jgi:hypothetical protein